MPSRELIVVRGAGDIATGVIQKFFRAGCPVLALEVRQPTAIRRTVALCEAVYNGTAVVEDMPCRLVHSEAEMENCFAAGEVPLAMDASGESIARLRPAAVVDAILAKRNLGTHLGMAPVTIGLGPGFTAGQDVSAVIETMRGHNLGRLYLYGHALPNTATPGEIGGQSTRRVVYASEDGVVQPLKNIGDVVHTGEPMMTVGQTFVTAPFVGLLRGMVHPGLLVTRGTKVADVDPRLDVDVATISDKARCIGGAALEAYLFLSRRGAKP